MRARTEGGWIRSVLSACACVAVVVVEGCGAWTHGKSAATFGCVSSVQAALGREFAAGRLRLLASSHEWTPLDDATRRKVLGELASHVSLDCGPADRTGPPLDSWGRPIQVSTRLVNGGMEFKTWSAGPDHRSGTEDDIIVPEGGRVPQPE